LEDILKELSDWDGFCDHSDATFSRESGVEKSHLDGDVVDAISGLVLGADHLLGVFDLHLSGESLLTVDGRSAEEVSVADKEVAVKVSEGDA